MITKLLTGCFLLGVLFSAGCAQDPAKCQPVVQVPESGTVNAVIPPDRLVFSKSWTEQDLDGSPAYCRAYDLDRDGTMDTIWCWREGKLVLRQWLNRVCSYETFTYGPGDSTPLSMELHIPGRDISLTWQFGPLSPIPTIPKVDRTYKKADEEGHNWVKKNWRGLIQSKIDLTEDGSLRTAWWQVDDRTAYLAARQPDGEIQYTRMILDPTRRLHRLAFQGIFLATGAVKWENLPVRTSIYPSPAFGRSDTDLNLMSLDVADRNQFTVASIRAQRPHGQGRSDVSIEDKNRDGNPESVVCDDTQTNAPGSPPFALALDDENSNGQFESVWFLSPEMEIDARSSLDNGTYDEFEIRLSGSKESIVVHTWSELEVAVKSPGENQ